MIHLALKSLNPCNITKKYEVVEGTYLTMTGDNCEKRLKEMAEASTADEYVFYSRKYVYLNSVHFNTECRFAYSGKVKLKRAVSSILLLYNKDCEDEHTLNNANEIE